MLFRLCIAIVSMDCGAFAYHIAVRYLHGVKVRHSELWPSYLTFGVAVVVVYLPVFFWVRQRRKDDLPKLLFALIGVLLSIVPAFFHGLLTDSLLPNRTSTETLLIYGMFGVSGFVFGWFYVTLCRFESSGWK